ncbi:MAG: carbamoyltransferase HypF [candidate division WOR-3 bacterium]
MTNKSIVRLKIVIRGAVQGVGFRPFIFRLATKLGLSGWVNNSPQGVFIEVEGKENQLKQFLLRIENEKPPRASIQSLESLYLDPVGYKKFEIRPSEEVGKKVALVLPDIATCPECIKEIFDPKNRRYQYPFTNCTNCGPRYSIIEALPYDRVNTTMKKFKMCEACQSEYENPLDRRFHAQPNACPVCGPHLELWNKRKQVLALHHNALLATADAIRKGKIVAVKGLGGFHLMVDGRNENAVRRLRRLKMREEKPFALMYPSLKAIKKDCLVSELEVRLLLSPEAPIVLLRRRASKIAQSVAPNNPNLGVMLPYTPLHHLLMAELGFPVVATSGNLSDEPICTDENEAVERLERIADLFLVHNRPIARHLDDSIVRLVMDRELVLRRARGYAPLPIHLNAEYGMRNAESRILAVGAHLKNTIAIGIGNDIFLSQHIGDLDNGPAIAAFKRVIDSFESLYEFKPKKIICDLHPDYLSTRFAESTGLPIIRIQHHYAHSLSVMAENELTGQVLSIAWDGTGFGLDNTVWGGEFLLVKDSTFERVAHLRTFRLPGGEIAIKEPRRCGIGILYEIFGEKAFKLKDLPTLKAFTNSEKRIIKGMLAQTINSPITSSVGRLFDAVASIIGLRQKIRFEGQAAMEMEFALAEIKTNKHYPYKIKTDEVCVRIDWEPMILEILKDFKNKVSLGLISAKFHNTLIEMIIDVAKRIGEKRVVLTGGCFQNKYLTERAVIRLSEEGFRPYWHQRVPPNDGGIALGQVFAGQLKDY